MRSKTIMAFDLGQRRIGTAVGQTLTHTARELKTVTSSVEGPDWKTITKLVREWGPDAFVVGLPLPADGNESSPMVRRVRKFGKTLQERYGYPVSYIDERLSTHAADLELRESQARNQSMSQRKLELRDSIAARLILETWFAANRDTDD